MTGTSFCESPRRLIVAVANVNVMRLHSKIFIAAALALLARAACKIRPCGRQISLHFLALSISPSASTPRK